MRPVKSRLHVPIWAGGPSGERLYTCPRCGHAGTAADFQAVAWTPEQRDRVAAWLASGGRRLTDPFERAAAAASARGAARDELLQRYALAARLGAPEVRDRAWRRLMEIVSSDESHLGLAVRLLASRHLGLPVAALEDRLRGAAPEVYRGLR